MGWFLILGAFFVFIIVLLATLVHRWYYDLKDMGRRLPARIIKYFVIAIACSMLYWVIGCIWPYDHFYKDEFYTNMNVTFPESGKIVYKVSDWMVGDACSIEVDSAIFKSLCAKLPGNCKYDDSMPYEIVGVTDHYNMKTQIQVHYRKRQGWEPACVVFLNDRKTIIYLSAEILPVNVY